ncbi:hypothetical protein [Streptomyces sp. NPDC059651]|uniref:hypothetical protein n=1 Tax=Streptomyces sp. NPDC059651 TaxID=3346897 RepID=UPI0036C44C28
MARTAITITALGTAGASPSGVAVAAQLTDGNSFPWAPSRHLFVANAAATPLTVTVQTPATVGPQARAVADATYTVAASTNRLLPALGTEFRRPSDGAVWVNYSGAAASVTVSVLDM